MKTARVILFLLGAALSGEAAADDFQVLGARFGAHADKMRFVLEMSHQAPYRAFTLPDPFRVVIDLPAFDWRVPEKEEEAGARGVITAIRHGLFAPGVGRVVLDSDTPVMIDAAFQLPPDGAEGHRFVLDLKRVPRDAYFARGERPEYTSEVKLRPASTLSTPPVPKPKPSDLRPLIVIDPGHGGVDPGAIGLSGLKEKEINLIYGKALAEALERSGRYRVQLTRRSDKFIKLRDRIHIAQKVGGELFISLHANNHASKNVRGVSVYTLSEEASDKEAAALAAAENAADSLGEVNLGSQSDEVRGILIDLAQRETMNLSKQFANTVVREVGAQVPLLQNTHRYAGFAVLKSPTIPSILFEIGYLSHPVEEREMQSEAHREKVVQSMINAIDRYFSWHNSVSRS